MRRGNRREDLRNDERAISPVVGVILMVAITVGLAALVGTFVYGYGGTLEQKPTPAFSVTREDSDTVSVVLHDKGGAAEIKGLLVKSPPVPAVSSSSLNGVNPTGVIEIGRTLKSDYVHAGDHYVVNGTVDGTNRVVIDRYV